MLELTKNVRKVHDLLELLDGLLSYKPNLSEIRSDLEILNRYYAPVRYPDALPGALPTGLPDKNEAAEAISSAGKILRAIERIIAP